jgi:two-component system, OmpR family, sensor histidine kinase SenX3
VLVAAILAAVLGLAVGFVLARAAQRPKGAAAASTPAPTEPSPQPLASLVVEALDEGVIVLDRDNFAILVNPAARAMGVLEVDRLTFADLTDLARVTRERRIAITRSIDLPIGRLGREPIALSATAVPLSPDVPDARDTAVALLLSDESEQRRLEAVRRDFVANVSHELKTPVGALTLLAEAVQDAAGDAPTVARFANRMQHEGARLTRLVGELMELSRVQGVDPMPSATPVDVRGVVEEAADRARLAAEQAGIEVAVTAADGLLVRGNEAQLITAVANLVDNAIAYSAAGTRVRVDARAEADHQARPVVEISITDQGLGIAEADLDRIFERFYRVDPARSRATGGTGLGLAIVKNIVTNHLGAVTVHSDVARGSTFTIRLPRVHSDASASSPEDVPAAARGIA